MGGVAWTKEEDNLLKTCIEQYGEGKWHRIPVLSGLNRCRKSCRLRWLNYLRPNIKRGSFAEDEVDLIIKLQKLLGNRWSFIAGKLPGRTANDVKNYWKCHLSKRLEADQDQADKNKPTTRNVKVFGPQPQNLVTSSKRPRSPNGPFPPPTLPTPSSPVREESSLSALASFMKQAEEDGGEGGPVLPKGDPANDYMEIGEQDLVGDLSMDLGFEEIKATYRDESCSSCSKWDSDDLILSMDLWSDSF